MNDFWFVVMLVGLQFIVWGVCMLVIAHNMQTPEERAERAARKSDKRTGVL